MQDATNLKEYRQQLREALENAFQREALDKFAVAYRTSRANAFAGIDAPELIAEIAASSVSYDYHVKRHVYRRNGVREYLIWRVDDGAIDWFILEEGEYVPLAPDESGVIRSKVFPGLWLAAQALLAGDLSTVLATLQQGAQSEAHAAFAAELAQRLATAP